MFQPNHREASVVASKSVLEQTAFCMVVSRHEKARIPFGSSSEISCNVKLFFLDLTWLWLARLDGPQQVPFSHIRRRGSLPFGILYRCLCHGWAGGQKLHHNHFHSERISTHASCPLSRPHFANLGSLIGDHFPQLSHKTIYYDILMLDA